MLIGVHRRLSAAACVFPSGPYNQPFCRAMRWGTAAVVFHNIQLCSDFPPASPMATPDNAPDRKVLQSWKEIATFLAVTVRSVQRWESDGLPVYRQGDGRKARVFAYPDELKQWLEAGGPREREPASEAVAAPESPPPRHRIPRKAWWAAAGVTVALAAVVLWRTGVFPAAPVPAHWTLDGSTLRVLDAAEHLCWERTLPPFGPAFDARVRDKVVIADIDGDGRMEVLLSYVPAGSEQAGRLMCLDHRERLRWESRFGAARSFGARQFDANYIGVFVKPVRAAGRRLLLTLSNPPNRESVVEGKRGDIGGPPI